MRGQHPALFLASGPMKMNEAISLRLASLAKIKIYDTCIISYEVDSQSSLTWINLCSSRGCLRFVFVSFFVSFHGSTMVLNVRHALRY